MATALVYQDQPRAPGRKRKDLPTWDSLLYMPPELIFHIFTFLSEPDILIAGQVSRQLYRLSQDDALWKVLCEKEYSKIEITTIQRSKSWRQLFYHKTQFENTRWSAKQHEPRHQMESDVLGFTSVSFNDEYIVAGTGSYDETFELSTIFVEKTISVYDSSTIRPLWRLFGHVDSIYDVKVAGNTVISAGTDRKIRIWKLPLRKPDDLTDINQPSLVLRGHRKSIYAVQAELARYRLIVSASRDTTVRIWNSDSGKCLRTLRGHQRDVFSVHFDNEKVASSSLDKTVKLWDLEYGKPILTIQDKLWNSVVRMTEKYVIAGGEGKIRVIDPRARGIVRSMKGHKGYFPPGWITSMQADENKIITGSYNRQIKIWDFNSGACINSWRAHTDKICSLQFDHHQLVTASRDRTLRVWDFSTDMPGQNPQPSRCLTM